MKWHSMRLGDFLTLKRGHDLPNDTRISGDVPVVSSSGITGYHNESKAFPPGVVTGRYGTLGEVFYIDKPYWPLNTALYVVDFKGNDPKFASYLLRNLLKGYQSDKAAVPGFDRNVLHEIPIKTLGILAQQRIAEILSAYDDLIENNQRRMKLLEESARLLYQEWFVRLRFPGYEHARIVDGVPEGWKWKKLGEIADVNSASLKSNFDGHIDYIDIGSVTPGSINETTPYEFKDAPGRARRIVRHGDVIWSCVRPNRRSFALVWNPNEGLIASTGFAVLTPIKTPASFLYYATTTDSFVGFLEKAAKGGAYPAVVSGDFERAEILVPQKTVMTQFHEHIEPIFHQRHALDLGNRKLRAARDLLLPLLMNGEIEV
jgi:type I restriction enzyme S subunit